MKSVFIGILLTVFLTACSSVKSVQRIPFPENEYAQLIKEGRSTVKGQIFMKTVGGDVKYGAGEEVFLNPVTSYSKQWYEVNYLGRKPLSPKESDSRLKDYMKIKQTNGSGQFEFKNIPAGEYYVVSRVTWRVRANQAIPEGGLIAKMIEVNENEEVEVMLTR